MRFKRLGPSGPKISSIGLGTGDFFWNAPISDSDKIGLIRLAVEQGINFIDTAEGYGNGKSETLVGEALHDCRDQVVLATKFSPEHHGYDALLGALDGSLKRLKSDRVELYQMHWPNPSVPLRETMRALRKAHRDGLIGGVGLSNCSLREVEEAKTLLEEVPILALQMEFNLFERTVETNGLLEFCQRTGAALIAYSPLDQGQTSAIDPGRKVLLESIASRQGASIPQLILNWLTSRDPVIAVTRTKSVSHLKDNAKGLRFTLSADEIKQIDAAFPSEYSLIDPRKIRVALDGEWNHKVYQTLEQALDNGMGFVPAPKELAEALKFGDCLKPVRLRRIRNTTSEAEYDLVAGRIRYWAWVIAHGNEKPIPAYLREEYTHG